MPEVKKVRYVDKPQAYKEFKTMFANTPDLVNSLGVPTCRRRTGSCPTRAEDVDSHRRPVQEPARREPGRVRQGGHQQPAEGLQDQAQRRAASWRSWSCSAPSLLIVNTIQLAIFARRREVAVMKLVGATNWFIRIPFMLEGMVHGVVGRRARVRRRCTSSASTIASFVSNEPARRRATRCT